MYDRRGRVLIVDNSDGTLCSALEPGLAAHDVEVVRDGLDAIHRIDCAHRAHDVIFCDLACEPVPGPELWAFLGLSRSTAAERVVFIASTPIRAETVAFLERIRNPCLTLPLDADGLHALVNRRASARGRTSGSLLATRAESEWP